MSYFAADETSLSTWLWTRVVNWLSPVGARVSDLSIIAHDIPDAVMYTGDGWSDGSERCYLSAVATVFGDGKRPVLGRRLNVLLIPNTAQARLRLLTPNRCSSLLIPPQFRCVRSSIIWLYILSSYYERISCDIGSRVIWTVWWWDIGVYYGQFMNTSQ